MRSLRIFSVVAALLLFAALIGCTPSIEPLSDERAAELTPIAEKLVSDFATGDTAAVYAVFDDTMKKAMPEDKIADGWTQLSAQSGAFTGIKSSSSYIYKGYETVEVVANCEKKNIIVRIVFSKDGTVSGLWSNYAS